MRTAIVTSFDSNYYEYSMVFLKSLGINYHGTVPLEVVCLVPEDLLSRESDYIDKVCQDNLHISFRHSNDFDKFIDQGLAWDFGYISKNCSHRLFLGSILSDFDEVIYIDPDTLIMRDIEPLLKYPRRSGFMAVIEPVNNGEKVFGDKDRPYFNNGVFIANLSLWNDIEAEKKMIDWTAKHVGTPFPDQDAMNAVLLDYLSPLPITFNFFAWQVDANPHTGYVFNDPLLVHFVGRDKPWLKPEREFGDRLYSTWWKVYRLIGYW